LSVGVPVQARPVDPDQRLRLPRCPESIWNPPVAGGGQVERSEKKVVGTRGCEGRMPRDRAVLKTVLGPETQGCRGFDRCRGFQPADRERASRANRGATKASTLCRRFRPVRKAPQRRRKNPLACGSLRLLAGCCSKAADLPPLESSTFQPSSSAYWIDFSISGFGCLGLLINSILVYAVDKCQANLDFPQIC